MIKGSVVKERDIVAGSGTTAETSRIYSSRCFYVATDQTHVLLIFTSSGLRKTLLQSNYYFSMLLTSSMLSPNMDPSKTVSKAGCSRAVPHSCHPMLPLLPRFHPANFLSYDSNVASDDVAINRSQPSLLLQPHRKQYSEAQMQTHLYQQELVGNAVCQNQGRIAEPSSPCLIPMIRSGPVTPLELESDKSHLVADVVTTHARSQNDKLIHEEVFRDRK